MLKILFKDQMTKFFTVSMELLYTDRAARVNNIAKNCIKKFQPIGIFACDFLHHDPWNNAFKAIMEKQEYKTLSLDL